MPSFPASALIRSPARSSFPWMLQGIAMTLLLSACGGGGGGDGSPLPEPQVQLSVSITGVGLLRSQPAGIDCSSSCSANFANGTTVTLTPTPANGFVFSSWGGACAGAGTSCTVTMSQARSVSATFITAPAQSFPLTVTRVGSGSVRSEPVGIDCGASCTASFSNTTTITLTATPATGQRFVGWTGACIGAGATCTVVTSEARSVTATFEATPPAPQWQPAALLENSPDFNVADTNPFADTNVLSAISPAGHAIVLWEQSDGQPNGSTRKVFSRLYTPNQGWAPAVQVPGLSTSSSLTDLVEGRLFINSSGGATWIRPTMETRRFSAAGGWGTPFFPPTQGGGVLTAAVMDGSGAIGVLISGADVYNNALSPLGTWGNWARVDASGSLTARAADVALSANGTALAVWREANPGDSRYSLKGARYSPNGGWQAPQSLETNLDDVVDEPRVVMDAEGNGIAFWHQGTSVYHAVFRPNSGWGAPTQVDAGQVNAGFDARLSIAMNADGRAVLAWASALYTLKTLQYTPGAGFSAPQAVASFPNDIRLGLDDTGVATLVYTAPESSTVTTPTLYSRRLVWGGSWSNATVLDSGAGRVKINSAIAFNRSGQGVAAWAQDDVATTDVRNSLWSALLR